MDDNFKILSDVITSVWGVGTIGFSIGYTICKLTLPNEKPVTTTKQECMIPTQYIGVLAQHKEISKTVFNHNSKVVDVSCYYKVNKNICSLTHKLCYHYK